MLRAHGFGRRDLLASFGPPTLHDLGGIMSEVNPSYHNSKTILFTKDVYTHTHIYIYMQPTRVIYHACSLKPILTVAAIRS